MAIENGMLADDGFKARFMSGFLVIDCPNILLTRIGDGPGHERFEAAGQLAVGPKFGARATLIFDALEETFFEVIEEKQDRRDRTVFGQIATGEYELSATDDKGNVWRNANVFVKRDFVSGKVHVTAECGRIHCQRQGGESGPWTRIVMADELDFPFRGIPRMNGESAGKVGALTVGYAHRKSADSPAYYELWGEAGNAAAMPAGFEDRLLEAARFATGVQAFWVMQETFNKGMATVELCGAATFSKGLMQPPLRHEGSERNFYVLMDCYFKYACESAGDKPFAPMTVKLAGLRSVSDVGYAEVFALHVGVTAETVLLEEYFKELGAPTDEALQAQKIMVEAIGKTRLRKELIDSGTRMLGGFASRSAPAKLAHLATMGAIEEGELDNWKKLRHPFAHGLEIHRRKMGDQTLLDRSFAGICLIHKLTFLRIGYTGPYTDYSTAGWPNRTYDATPFRSVISELGKQEPAEPEPPAGVGRRFAAFLSRLWGKTSR